MSALRLSSEHAAWAELAAMLVNTAPRETDPPEKLVGIAELEALLAVCPEPAPAAGEHDLRSIRELRPALVEAFEATSPAAFAEAVNPLLARSPWQLTAEGDTRLTLGPVVEQRPADWLAARAARGLAELVMAYGLDRLHMCSADDCLRAVVDVSRNGTRRYCSRTCANRTNARRHRERA